MAQTEAKQEQWYCFSNDIPPGKTIRQVVDDIARQPGIRFVAQFTGEYKIFAAAEFDAFEELQSAIAENYGPAGLSSQWVKLDQSSRIEAPKRGSPDNCAIVKVKTNGVPKLVMDAIDDRFQDRYQQDHPDHHFFSYGACTVVPGPDFQILVDLGADSLEEVVRTAKEDLRGVDGVLPSISMSLSFLPGNAKRPGNPDES
jgi:hypothetical protein